MTDRGIRLIKNKIAIDDKVIPWLSGECHYWRLDPARWPMILENFVELGFPILQTYVPWSVHETAQGQYDFGLEDPAKDLPAFLELCTEMGLFVFLRPGPHINAEITYFGFPKRLFENPENLAVSATGGPVLLPAPPRTFPAISYNSERFFAELEVWFDAFAQIAAPYCHPNGPVIGLQPDNEMSYFFRTGAYDQDYSHWAEQTWHSWLIQKYQSLDAIREAYSINTAAINDIPMPKAFLARRTEDIPYYLDWAQFKEHNLLAPTERIRNMLFQRGFDGLLTFANYPMTNSRTPFNIAQGEKILDVVGVDFYPQKADYHVFKKQVLALCGLSRLPVSPEFSSGCYQAWAPIDLDDQKFTTYCALAYGLKGVNFYMTVERERWYGSPIARQGKYHRKYADFYERLLRFLEETDLFSMERNADIVLLLGRDYDRFEKATDLLCPLPPLVFSDKLHAAERCHEGDFGLGHTVQIDHETMYDAWLDGLTKLKIPFALADTEIPADMLNKYRVAITPTFDFMERETQVKLRDYAEAGGILVVGPDLPTRDAAFKDFSTLDHYASRPVVKLNCTPDTVIFNTEAGRMIIVSGLLKRMDESVDQVIREICKTAQLRAQYQATGVCETSLFTRKDGRNILFVINPSESIRRPQIKVEQRCVLRDLLTDERFYGGDNFVVVDMDPHHVRPLEIEPC